MSVCLYVIYILQNGLIDFSQILGRGKGQNFLENEQNIKLEISVLQLKWVDTLTNSNNDEADRD